MHATLPHKPPRPQQPNRRERRRNARARKPADVVWRGRCECDECVGRTWPHVYTLACSAVREWRDKAGRWHRQTAARVSVSYECFVESVEGRPSLDQRDEAEVRSATREVRTYERHGGAWTTESASAEAMQAVASDAMTAATVRRQEQLTMADMTPERDVELLLSLREYLAEMDVSEDERRQRESVYLAIRRDWGERRYRRRMWGRLAAEFPGWLERERGTT